MGNWGRREEEGGKKGEGEERALCALVFKKGKQGINCFLVTKFLPLQATEALNYTTIISVALVFSILHPATRHQC